MIHKHTKRILIVGDSGRGKSTLAAKLSSVLNIPHHSTDDYFYETKFTLIRDKQESIAQISQLYTEETWIVEGTTRNLIKPGLENAEIIIYLTYKNIIFQWITLIRRHLGRKEESFTGLLQLLKYALYKRYNISDAKRNTTLADMIHPYKNKILKLDSFAKIDSFVKSLPFTEKP